MTVTRGKDSICGVSISHGRTDLPPLLLVVIVVLCCAMQALPFPAVSSLLLTFPSLVAADHGGRVLTEAFEQGLLRAPDALKHRFTSYG